MLSVLAAYTRPICPYFPHLPVPRQGVHLRHPVTRAHYAVCSYGSSIEQSNAPAYSQLEFLTKAPFCRVFLEVTVDCPREVLSIMSVLCNYFSTKASDYLFFDCRYSSYRFWKKSLSKYKYNYRPKRNRNDRYYQGCGPIQSR